MRELRTALSADLLQGHQVELTFILVVSLEAWTDCGGLTGGEADCWKLESP